MVLHAVMHMFYKYFAGRYKLRYEILWVTGIILGVVTIIEAYTGYDLIFNIRGQLAINIGQTLTYYTPVLGANLAQIIFGFSFNDLTIRFYAFHVFIIPIIMLAIMSIHLPKNLVVDIPSASAITGMILILGGLFPVEVGGRYDPNQLTQITFPEWDFTSLYAFILTQGLPPFIPEGIIPGDFLLIFTGVPLLLALRGRLPSSPLSPTLAGLSRCGCFSRIPRYSQQLCACLDWNGAGRVRRDRSYIQSRSSSEIIMKVTKKHFPIGGLIG